MLGISAIHKADEWYEIFICLADDMALCTIY